MRIAEILRESEAFLYQALKTVQSNADADKKPAALHFDGIKNPVQGAVNLDLNRVMSNVGSEAFSFDTFNNAYEQDPRIKDLVQEFDNEKLILKTQEQMSEPAVDKDDAEKDIKADAAQGHQNFLKNR